MRRGTRIALIVIPLVLLLGGGITGLVLKQQRDNDVREKREHAEQARQAAEKRDAARKRAADAAAEAQAAIDRIEREKRRLLETAVRRAIRKDVNEKISEDLLEGPTVGHVRCDPVGGGSDSFSEPTARYECLAVNETDYSDGSERGYSYKSTINFDKGSYSWQLGN